MINICISAIASNEGKTILTTALLHHFKKSVRPFKIGPDFIDPQFHKKVCATDSVNLDTFIMKKSQVQWLYNNYSDKKVSILEGVMGFYDGEDKGCSAYGVTKLLNVPTVLILNGRGSYITVSAVLKGLKTYKKDNTIKAVVINKLNSAGHYELIKRQIEKDFSDVKVVGWIQNGLETLQDTHLGLDLNDLEKIDSISKDVLKHIDLEKIEKIGHTKRVKNIKYPFKKYKKVDKTIAIVNDVNFSFLYYDNLQFLKESFKSVVLVDSTKDEKIPNNSDAIFICGGYVETYEAYNRVKNSNKFKESLVEHSKSKKIYAECAGLLYLGNRVDEKQMSSILDVDFTKKSRFARMGYYYNEDNVKGHSFHYSDVIDSNNSNSFDVLSKVKGGDGRDGSWQSDNKKAFGTFLHTMFRGNVKLLKDRF